MEIFFARNESSWYSLSMKSVVLEVLTSPGCVHCHAFLEFWKTVQKDWPNVAMKETGITTPEGQEIAGRHMIFASPGIIINGELWASGGFDRERFIKKLVEASK